MACLRSPALQKMTGTPRAAPQALTRRASRPAISSLTKDDRHAARRAPGLDPPREPTRHPHQMGVIEPIIRPMQPPPPDPKPTRVVPPREVAIEHDPVHAVVRAAHQVRVPLTELIGHAGTVETAAVPAHLPGVRWSCPEGATDVGRSPKIS